MDEGIIQGFSQLGLGQNGVPDGINPCPKSIQNLFLPVSDVRPCAPGVKVFKFLFYVEKFVAVSNSLTWDGCFRALDIFRQGIDEISSQMKPTKTSLDAGHFVVTGIGVRMKVSIESFKEFLRVLAASTRPVIEDPDLMRTVLTGAVDPHVGIRGILASLFI